jgi:hypothetical protein
MSPFDVKSSQISLRVWNRDGDTSWVTSGHLQHWILNHTNLIDFEYGQYVIIRTFQNAEKVYKPSKMRNENKE